MARLSLLCLALLALVSIEAVSALPVLFTQLPGQCGKQPKQAYGPHLPPKADKNIKWTIKPAAGGAAIKAPGPLRPGTKYLVTASWVEAYHHALLTTSQGTWAKIPVGVPAGCKTSSPSPTTGKTYSNIVVLAATAKGNITFAVTHSMPGNNYFQGSTTYKIQPKTGKML